jgi:carbamoyl-phosphate synthase large subunit
MPKNTNIKKIMVIGSGPIVIGQAAEFDYAGTQACIALREEGYEVILVNSNPATIMTDTNMADKVYLEPLDLEHVARIVRKERPCALLCNLGGQTGLNLGMQLYKKGVLDECRVQVLGTNLDGVERAEDRKLFKEFCLEIGEPVIESHIAVTLDEARVAAKAIGYPVVLRPAFTLGGTGGGFAYNDDELDRIAENALSLSPVHQVLVEKSIKGMKEIEFEVVRDAKDQCVVVCGMENIDPVGVHTGDSIVVAPTFTLNDADLKMLRDSAVNIVRNVGIVGGCNVQYGLCPETSKYYVIEINPRVSRSSALASKATAYPIARIATKIAVGYSLDEIKIAGATAIVEPKLDYVVAKFPRFPFDKFVQADRRLSTQMKATGEVMSIGDNIESAFLKAIRSLELGYNHIQKRGLEKLSESELWEFTLASTDETIFGVSELLWRGVSVAEIHERTKWTAFFVEKIKNIVDLSKRIGSSENLEILREAKKMGFSDEYIGECWHKSAMEIYQIRKANNIYPSFKMIATDGTGQYIPYFYSSYTGDNQSILTKREKVIVLGSGPVRIGQGVEFDYSTVHAVWAIQELGYEAIIINNNPETVSTDFTTGDKLYFEPLTFEDVMNVIDFEKPIGVVCSLGGQTAINLADDLDRAGVKILGSDNKAIAEAEDRDLFTAALDKMGIPVPAGKAVTSVDEAKAAAEKLGFPLLVRPSFVLGGRMMHIVYDEAALVKCATEALKINPKYPILVDKYITGKECEVDAVCDSVGDVFIPGIMEHIERAGVHSGDSISVYPTFSMPEEAINKMVEYTKKIGKGLRMLGPFNIQFVIDSASGEVYVIEVNPRSSRTVPFLAKAVGVPVADIATQVMFGKTLKELGHIGLAPARDKWFVKTPTFSNSKIAGSDSVLSPEMKSTGETIGYDRQLSRAVYKSLKAAGIHMQNYGTVFVTVTRDDRDAALPLVKRFYDLGFNIVATKGTALFLKEQGVRSRILERISQGSEDIPNLLRSGYVAYVINTSGGRQKTEVTTDGSMIRWLAVQNKVPLFTCLDTVKIVLDVLEEVTTTVSRIDE